MLREKNSLGNTALFIPPVIFGTSALGNLYAELDEETGVQIVKACFDHVQSPVVFDSAGKYGAGLALETLGRCLKKLGVKSGDVIISNKVGWQRVPLKSKEPAFEPGVWKNIKNDARQMISYDGILACWEQGNRLLGSMYKPVLVSVHDPDEYIGQASDRSEHKERITDILDAYQALSDLKASGEIRGIGIGAKNWQTIEMLEGEIELDWVMFANSMTIFSHPPELLKLMARLHKKGIGIINSAVFNAGFLIGGDYFDYRLIKPDSPENRKIFKWREDFFGICNKHGVRPATACVHFGMTPPGVISVSLNTSKPAHVKMNVDSVIADVPAAFYHEMKEKGLIRKDYPYVPA
ncbi:MAG: aldo/keto reductase [Bacteroidales bacterium]|nr:aldo/keto reductase [Bacteroidales bacterium]